jgi:uncharacterized membrane protein YphA (DoxX/SURF4 family)
MSFWQFFLGLLFVVSGLSKAIDPFGTGLKMLEYFQEFVILLQPGWFSFLIPLLGMMEQHALFFSILLIILEIVVGIMLVIGFKPKLTAWLFLVTMIIFTILTGYTYLTGYVPRDVNFFEFSKWSEYTDSNMRVTDCGCFGDFIKFSAWSTFLKNLFMIIPAFYLILRSGSMHRIFSYSTRMTIVIASVVFFYFFNLYNYKWSEPIIDFRPFKEGVNILERKELEWNAAANVREISVILQNRNTSEKYVIPAEQYYEMLDQYPVDEFMVMDRIYEEAEIPKTEIFDYYIEDFNGDDVLEEVLSDENYLFMILSPDMKAKLTSAIRIVQDTVFLTDTVTIDNNDIRIVKSIDKIVEREIEDYGFEWDKKFMQIIEKRISPLINAAREDGLNVIFTVSATEDMVASFINAGGPDVPYYQTDETSLMTFLRSNPGVVLLKNGTIIKKWHYKRLPDYDKIKRKYMK